MFLLLLGAVAIYLALGDVREALVLAASMLAVIAIAVYQQHRTERALEALRDLSSPRALVIRDGAEQRIPGRDVVRGDVVLLREGDRVPADGLLRDGRGARGRRIAAHRRIASRRQERRSRRAADGASGRSESPRCIPARWWCTATASRKCSPPGRAAKSAGSAARSPRSDPKRRRCRTETRRVVQGSRWPGSRCARSSRSPTACCAATGPRRSWPASRSRWESCPRNFRSS